MAQLLERVYKWSEIFVFLLISDSCLLFLKKIYSCVLLINIFVNFNWIFSIPQKLNAIIRFLSFTSNLQPQQNDALLSQLRMGLAFLNILSRDSSYVHELMCEICNNFGFCKWDWSPGFTWLQESDHSRPTSNHELMEWLHTFLQLVRCQMWPLQ